MRVPAQSANPRINVELTKKQKLFLWIWCYEQPVKFLILKNGSDIIFKILLILILKILLSDTQIDFDINSMKKYNKQLEILEIKPDGVF